MPPLPAGARVFVDTAPFIYLLEDHPRYAPRFQGLFEAEAAGQVMIVTSVITLAEVLTGPFKAGQEALARRYERALRQFELVAVDASVAAQAARLRARYRLKLPDAMQLACALESGCAGLVTHDRDYAAVKGLPIWMQAPGTA